MAKYILATNTEVSLLSHGPSSHHYHFEKHQSIMHTQQSFGGKCPCSQKLPFRLRNWGCFTHHPWQMVPLLSLRAGNSLTFSHWSQNLLFIGLNAFLPQDLSTCWPLIQMVVPRSLHSSYLQLPSHPFSDEIIMKPSPDCSFQGPDSTFPSLASTPCPTFPALWRQKNLTPSVGVRLFNS